MKENIVQKLTSKDDKYACAFTDRIVAESHDTDEWYEYFEDVASLPDHPKSLVRNRALSGFHVMLYSVMRIMRQ